MEYESLYTVYYNNLNKGLYRTTRLLSKLSNKKIMRNALIIYDVNFIKSRKKLKDIQRANTRFWSEFKSKTFVAFTIILEKENPHMLAGFKYGNSIEIYDCNGYNNPSSIPTNYNKMLKKKLYNKFENFEIVVKTIYGIVRNRCIRIEGVCALKSTLYMLCRIEGIGRKRTQEIINGFTKEEKCMRWFMKSLHNMKTERQYTELIEILKKQKTISRNNANNSNEFKVL